MNRKLLKLSLICVAGIIMIAANPKKASAFEDGVAGYVYDKNNSTNNSVDGATAENLSVSDIPIPGFMDICIANVDTNLLIREGAGENYNYIGKLPKNAGCNKLEDSKDGWTKISAETSSGETITGYVKSQYLITGAAATALAREVGNYVVKAKDNLEGNLNVRAEASTNSEIIEKMAKGEELLILDANVPSNDKNHPVWVKVSLDSDTEEGSVGYVAKDLVDPSFELVYALSKDEINYGSGVSSKRINIVNFAADYLGGKYRYGGTSLTNGIDCSAFVRACLNQFGINDVPRTSREQASSRNGEKISASELKPGDLVFYGSSSYINHVAMYIGNGKVIHASNRRDGIKISNMYYRTPVKFVTYIHD